MIQKIAIVGPESTGKTTLARDLAQHFETSWVREYAREYLDNLTRPYIQTDLLEIALGQLKKEQEKVVSARKYLICDTNLLVIKIWSQVKYGACDGAILKLMNLQSYTHHFLTVPDIPWTYDPQREHPHQRQELFEIYQEELLQAKVPFTLIHGNEKERLFQAISKING